jgi:hypothetical protein|tara:strand:+ start:485 stop:601 length:117 start_codon:yes stop_codon:yes gene_type:complete
VFQLFSASSDEGRPGTFFGRVAYYESRFVEENHIVVVL